MAETNSTISDRGKKIHLTVNLRLNSFTIADRNECQRRCIRELSHFKALLISRREVLITTVIIKFEKIYIIRERTRSVLKASKRFPTNLSFGRIKNLNFTFFTTRVDLANLIQNIRT